MLDNSQLQALLARVVLKDRAAFRQLYDVTSPHLFAAALRITNNSANAEEALQDAYVQVWQNAGTFQPDRAQPGAWLTSIVRYRALDLVRKRGREVPMDEVPENALPAESPAGPGEPALMRCLSLLTPESRSFITLAFVEGYSHDELSRRHSTPLGTVKSLIRRGLQQLKECLGQ